MAGKGRGFRRTAVQDLRAAADQAEASDEEEHIEAVGGQRDPEVSNGSHEPTLSDLKGILHAHMAQLKEQEEQIDKHFFWPGMRADVDRLCKSCPKCQNTVLRAPCKHHRAA
ncbi:hypothetical protein ACEWY4_025528 [Coilia grayii]|uniref:Integrase zinc-binding domain-containing protein n=1 Tax=Coilia grayii TaxID=363190 RepID=A0ABD1IXX2_9TELE